MVTFATVDLFQRCWFKISSNPDAHNEYTASGMERPMWKYASSTGVSMDESYKTHTFTNVTPRKGREYREMELPIDSTILDGLSSVQKMPKFIRIAPNSNMYIFGWIDEIIPVATKGPNQNTLIRWHVDYWITYSALNGMMGSNPALANRQRMILKSGRIKRGPADYARPDPTVPRRWVVNKTEDLKDGRWVLVYYHSNGDGNNYIATFEVGGTITGHNNSFGMSDVYNQTMLDEMGIDPDDVFGIWAVPWHIGTAFTIIDGVSHSWYRGSPTSQATRSFPLTETTVDDYNKVVITDAYGNAAGTVPWGVHYNYYSETIDIGTSGCNLILSLAYVPGSPDPNVVYPPVEGGVITVPCPSIPVFSNALSSYILSGQYKYDRDTADYARHRSALSGITGVGNSMIGGAVAGSIAAPGIGTIAGLIGGASSSLIGTGADFLISSEFDEKSLQATYRLMADQACNALIGAGGPLWFSRSDSYCVVRMKRDDQSLAELVVEQSHLGYVTDYYAVNLDTKLQQGGGFRIEGMEIKGDILPEGMRQIQALFARGVYIDFIQ